MADRPRSSFGVRALQKPLLPVSKTIDENKLKAFNQGAMNLKKTINKKELEELKKKQDEVEAAKAYQDFVESFEDSGKVGLNQVWVKGETVKEARVTVKPAKPQLYKPKSKMVELVSQFESARPSSGQDRRRSKFNKSEESRKRSNLEAFKEELKSIQSEREQRHRAKSGLIPTPQSHPPTRKSRFEQPTSSVPHPKIYGEEKTYNYDDSVTTNLYLGNINPAMSESELCEIFGMYGPLASIKIMWPRSDDERSRNRNCGFVAFMNRKDCERAFNALQGSTIMDYEMKLGWGKAISIPSRPVYIPQSLRELTQPPPPSGLPFNAQPSPRLISKGIPTDDLEELEKSLGDTVVKVVVPAERPLVATIHRMIEFVVREGPMFEAMIMNRELNNPHYRFLFENQSPAHVYYRWKLYSILQGDGTNSWPSQDFRMFQGSSIWRPPPINPYTSGMPDNVTLPPTDNNRGLLSDGQRDRLEEMLRELECTRTSIGDGMLWCLDHADSAEEISSCITESLSISETPIQKKIARLFLISDILYNSSAKVLHASYFRKYFELKLADIFKCFRETHEQIDARLKAEQFKQKVVKCFQAWEDWSVYPNELLINMQNVFLGLVPQEDCKTLKEAVIEDVDGLPMEDLVEDIELSSVHEDEELDGIPLEPERADVSTKFVASKWEAVDSSQLEMQAMTTSKWDVLDANLADDDVDGKPMEDVDGKPMDESPDETSRSVSPIDNSRVAQALRAKLRDIEVKVVKYQDDVEANRRNRKSGMTLVEQVEKYRQKLMAKEKERISNELVERTRSEKRDDSSHSPVDRHRSRSHSPRRRHYSPRSSPRRSSRRSRSRSPRRHRHHKRH